jgi:hypothetical protein
MLVLVFSALASLAAIVVLFLVIIPKPVGYREVEDDGSYQPGYLAQR